MLCVVCVFDVDVVVVCIDNVVVDGEYDVVVCDVVVDDDVLLLLVLLLLMLPLMFTGL